ncbi:MAG TPA: ABC transporter substrate-binding protein [Devosiaceae bacterium]
MKGLRDWRSHTARFAATLALLAGAALVPTVALALDQVPREDTLVSESWPTGPAYKNYENMNPFSAGNDLRNHVVFTSEPLFYWNQLNNDVIPFLATGYTFNDDYTQVTVSLRDGVTWSDGQPFTADDVAFTFELLRSNGEGKKDLLDSTLVATAVQSVNVVDPHTVRFDLKQPDPRFVLRILTVSFTTGFFPVPKHIWEKVEDPANFNNFDLAKGWPVVTGPYKVVDAKPERIIMDRRDDWWGTKDGVWGDQAGAYYSSLPVPKRIITVPGMDIQQRAQALMAGDIDWGGGESIPVIKSMLAQRPDIITTFTGDKPPYGYTDWWPTALWFNLGLEKFQDKNVRLAMRYALNPQQVIDIVHEGASKLLVSPFPDFKAFQPYIEDATVMAKEHELNVQDVDKSAALMEKAGYAKDADGFWAKDGVRLSANIIGAKALDPMGPIIAEQFRRAGFDITFANRPDYRAVMTAGKAELMLWGFNGGTYDPYDTLELFDSRYAAPIGESSSRYARYKNPEVDQLAEEIKKLPINDERIRPLVKRFVEIWMDDVINIPIAQWYNQVAFSTQRWTNWPNEDNPYAPPINGHWTVGLVVHGLQKAGN